MDDDQQYASNAGDAWGGGGGGGDYTQATPDPTYNAADAGGGADYSGAAGYGGAANAGGDSAGGDATDALKFPGSPGEFGQRVGQGARKTVDTVKGWGQAAWDGVTGAAQTVRKTAQDVGQGVRQGWNGAANAYGGAYDQ